MNWFYKNTVNTSIESTNASPEVYITFYKDGDVFRVSCGCPTGQENRFADLWLVLTCGKNSDDILSAIKLNVSDESYNKILDEINKITELIKSLQNCTPSKTSEPLVKPSDVFRNIENATRTR